MLSEVMHLPDHSISSQKVGIGIFFYSSEGSLSWRLGEDDWFGRECSTCDDEEEIEGLGNTMRQM
jgi:hypothetical protein